MFLSEVYIHNFRQFGQADGALTIRLNKGVTALIGQNDAGKSTVIDAIRFALLTRDQEFVRVQPEDFHIEETRRQADEICIRCKLSDLTISEKGAFAEYLSYEDEGVALYVNWTARRLHQSPGSRRWVDVSVRSGVTGTGPALESSVRALLSTAYLRPLRDAQHEMSPGRGSRLSQILAHVPEIDEGKAFDSDILPSTLEALKELSLVGLADYFKFGVDKHPQVGAAQETINTQYLSALALTRDQLQGRIAVSEGGTSDARLRQILERLELDLFEAPTGSARGRYGLGSNNVLFMACELLLLGKEPDSLPLLLIEEPEAHLHPQRQLRLMEFLITAADGKIKGTDRGVQVILTTHSPNLASKVPLNNMILMEGRHAFPLAEGETRLNKSDYRFLERYLDVTKANLFFAGGVVIVEGDAEAILLPTLAKLIDKDFTVHGVSVVNVGGTGLRRFSRILQRPSSSPSKITVHVACIADMDVMPDCAPEILGLVKDDDDEKWASPNRRWHARRDFGQTSEEQSAALLARRARLREDDEQTVETFVADHWTFEYDLAYAGLAEEVYVAASLAKNDDPLNADKKQRAEIEAAAGEEFTLLEQRYSGNREVLCSAVYKLFRSEGASKAIAAQYLAELLTKKSQGGQLDAQHLRARLPRYLVDAVDHVTPDLNVPETVPSHEGQADV